MSQQLINRSPDLKKLRDEGFEIAVISGFLVMRNVPYVNSKREVKLADLVSELTLVGDTTAKPNTHVIHFTGEYPCDKNGHPLTKIVHGTGENRLRAAMHCSSFSVSMHPMKSDANNKSSISAPESWRRNIYTQVTIERADFAHYFDKSVSLRGSGVPIAFGFLSANYVAQFDAIQDTKGIHQVLVRAQSKLWQLDRLRDEGSLFKPNLCELLLKTPEVTSTEELSPLSEFIEELKYEASRRELGIYTAESPIDAAKHLIKNAA